MDAFIDLEDPSDWPRGFEHLRELEKLLRCPVCKEYLETPMVVSGCGHTFCSLCVRRCIAQETKCPSCRAQTAEGDLYPNRLIESIMREFRNGRLQLLSAIHAAAKSDSLNNPRKKQRVSQGSLQKDAQSVASTLSADTACSGSNNESANSGVVDLSSSDIEKIADTAMAEEDNDSDSDFVANAQRKRPRENLTTCTSEKIAKDEETSSNSVSCPNCRTNIRSNRINWHLDRCLAGLPCENTPAAVVSVSSTKSQPTAAKLQLLPPRAAQFALPRPTKLAYSLLSESKLRRTLRELGIPSKGDKHQMQMRHTEWVNIFMANADSETPVSHRVLLRRLSAWEDALSRQSETVKAVALSTPEDIAQHASKYADSFAELVAQAGSSRSRPSFK
ncbi:E3 ubiquitin-protein ligase rad18 [Coemansia erecta]|uniref:Postreplication repair E3 ubiquitin-protein ligase RAD18 n=1 Tax=Coemansia asiatica TaxID=1052880 RepID=A0A9W7XIB2_9FUNG|nr:E3 ubiquitin-protein ligase rad18 [Coemansia asiatica]KAJ2855627.1 E3 ubiquitin-protein ligase rad18 [Coemansia erecta]KAJ2888048.1 E3 ubiquitin-protein ligase rad18 [Coemansia asiatica]